MTNKTKKNVYAIMTERILELLDKGTVPWHRPWQQIEMPRSLKSKKVYRGINFWMLMCRGYDSPFWLTYKQASDMGGQIRKGEKGTPIVYWIWFDKKDKDTGEVVGQIPYPKYYTVFNTEQVDGIEDKVPTLEVSELDFEPIAYCESLVEDIQSPKITIKHEGDRATYTPVLDYIKMPDQKKFDSVEEYYSTLFHEMAHATGHKGRLNRKSLVEHDGFGGNNYSQEELVAEFTASFLCGMTGIENKTIDNSAAYIKGWAKKLKEETKLVMMAAAQAQKASDWLTEKWRENKTEETSTVKEVVA